MTSTAVLYFTGLRPCSFWVLWIYLTSQVIVKKQYRLYPPNSKFHDPAPPTVYHNWMTTTPTLYDNRGSSSALLFLVYGRILLLFNFLNVSCILTVNFVNLNKFCEWKRGLGWVTVHQCRRARFPYNKPFPFHNLFLFAALTASALTAVWHSTLLYTVLCAVFWYNMLTKRGLENFLSGTSQELQDINWGRAKSYRISLKFNLHPSTLNSAL